MKAHISIMMDNAAFDSHSGEELARILRNLADRIDCDQLEEDDRYGLMDFNGNKVGELVVE